MTLISTQPERCLITGASGFIGNRLCKYFDEQKRQDFVPFVRSPEAAARMRTHWPQLVEGDLLKPAQVTRALAGCDSIIHLAHGGQGSTATRMLVESAIRQGIRRFVHISTMSVHGPRPGPEAASEDTARIERYNHDYSDSKAEQEEIVQAAHTRGDLEAVILRPTIVYGPNSHFVLQIIEEARNGSVSMFDHGHGICNAVYVDDVCRAIEAALSIRNADGQAMFINGDENLSWGKFIQAFAFMKEPRPQVVDLPSAPALDYWTHHPPVVARNLFERVGLKFKRMLGATPQKAPWPPLGRIQRETFPVFFLNGKAKRVLGWTPQVDFASGVALTQAWLAGEGYLS